MSKNKWHLRMTMKSLLLSTSFIGAGIGCLIVGFTYLSDNSRDRSVWWQPVFAALQLLGGGPLLGAGLLKPFQRARLGAYVGFFLPIVSVICYATVRAGWRIVWEEPIARQVIALTALVLLLGVFNVLRRAWRSSANRPSPSAPTPNRTTTAP